MNRYFILSCFQCLFCLFSASLNADYYFSETKKRESIVRYSIEFDPLDLWVTVYGMVMMPLGGAIYRYGNIRERDNIAGVGFIVVIGGLSFVISGISSLNQYGDVGVCQPYKCPSTRK